MLKIGMIDADLIDNGTRHPNLAQMKMSYYCKNKLGHSTELVYGDNLKKLDQYDLLIVSKVFTFTKLPDELASLLPSDPIKLKEFNIDIIDAVTKAITSEKKPIIAIGGTGFFEDGGINLAHCIEHCMPDYSLYTKFVDEMVENGYSSTSFDDYRYFSIGFTTRGCFRKCQFCVNKKYSRSFKNSELEEFVDESRPMIYLWDDNIFSFGIGWEAIFNQLNMTGKPFQFRQGLDIRLLTEKRAEILARSKYYGDYIFAFDYIDQKDLIIKRLIRWRKFCKSTTKLYVLCAYSPTTKPLGKDTIEYEKEDIVNTFERIKILMEFGCLPYIMRYEAYKNSNFKDLYIQLARWCNQPQFFKKKSFREFCKANQDYSKSKNLCTSYRAMTDFEEKYPEIAKKYFDLRYDDVSKYDLSFNYGRIKTEPCEHCIQSSLQWDSIFFNGYEWIAEYFRGTLDTICLLRADAKCSCAKRIDLVCKKIVDTLLEIPSSKIIEIIDRFPITTIDISEIPQGSNIDDASNNLIRALENDNMSYDELGEKLYKGSNTPNSNKKYGENHAKLGSLLDMAIITNDPESTKGRRMIVQLSPLGRYLLSLNDEQFYIVRGKLFFRIKLIQQLVIHSKGHQPADMIEIMGLSGAMKTTMGRRASTVSSILSEMKKYSDVEASQRLSLIK